MHEECSNVPRPRLSLRPETFSNQVRDKGAPIVEGGRGECIKRGCNCIEDKGEGKNGQEKRAAKVCRRLGKRDVAAAFEAAI